MRRRLSLTMGLMLLSGCPSNPLVTPPGTGAIKDLTPAATSADGTFKTPLDAALSPDGKTAYFVGLEDGQAAVYSTPAPSTSAPTRLHLGAPLVSPFGIDVSLDGKTIVLSDPGAQLDPENPARGELFSLSASGSTPAVISGASGFAPRAVVLLTVNNVEVATFSGRDPTTKETGVFQIPLAGGTVTTLAKGGLLRDPTGVALAHDGTAYVIDADADGSEARLLKVTSDGTVSVMLSPITIGFPAGVALSQDEKTVLVSAKAPEAGTDAVLRVPVAGGETEVVTTGIDQFQEPAGLHRARNVDTYIWADSRANGGGTVFVINKQQ
ncbi:MAG: hypothetical protein QM817_04925 [Archangium sp.]